MTIWETIEKDWSFPKTGHFFFFLVLRNTLFTATKNAFKIQILLQHSDI